MSDIKLTGSDPSRLKVDCLVVAVTSSGKEVEVYAAECGKKALAALTETAAALGVKASAGYVQLTLAPAEIAAETVCFVGLPNFKPSTLRAAAGSAARHLINKVKTVGLCLPARSEVEMEAVALGAMLGSYTYARYQQVPCSLDHFEICSDLAAKSANLVINHSQIVAESMCVARDLVNAAPNDLYPDSFAQQASVLAKNAGVSVKIYDEKALAKENCHGILAVGQGSHRPPRLVRLEYCPRKPQAHCAFVGKGITFDTGGISLKPGKGMDAMRSDMAGAATVLATVLAAARLQLPVKVTGWLAMAENMPGGHAQRPGDIITMANGKTVEVLNTDAEGRLVMADALTLAGRENPDSLIDIATLTGAAVLALGERTAAVMGDDEITERVLDASDSTDEAFWPLPLPEYLKEGIKSKYADLANIGARPGGALTAGLFLENFTEGRPWAHLDVAGPAYNEGAAWGEVPFGGTGFGVPTLVAYLENTDGLGDK